MSRGNRKEPIFDDDHDRRVFMDTVDHVARRYSIRCYALCLMGNHYHFVFITPRGNLSAAMRQLNGVYTQTSNRRHNRTGHVFEGRFRSIVVQRESYLRRVVRYVVRNPVRAGLVDTVAGWPWSTYRATVGIEPAPAWLDMDWLPWAFDAATPEDARERYLKYVNDPTPSKTLVNWHDIAFGSRRFVEAHIELARAFRVDRTLPGVMTLPAPPPLDALFHGVMSRQDRDRVIADAHVTHGYCLAEISRHLGFQAAMASKAFRRFNEEKAREELGRR